MIIRHTIFFYFFLCRKGSEEISHNPSRRDSRICGDSCPKGTRIKSLSLHFCFFLDLFLFISTLFLYTSSEGFLFKTFGELDPSLMLIYVNIYFFSGLLFCLLVCKFYIKIDFIKYSMFFFFFRMKKYFLYFVLL